MTDILYKEESYQIVGAGFEVYNEVGSGFLEAVYQECLALELERKGIPFVQQPSLQISYKGLPLNQRYQPDFLCYSNIILEIKAVKALGNEHRAQVVNYLKASGHELGLLVNFGSHPKLEYERFVNKRKSLK